MRDINDLPDPDEEEKEMVEEAPATDSRIMESLYGKPPSTAEEQEKANLALVDMLQPEWRKVKRKKSAFLFFSNIGYTYAQHDAECNDYENCPCHFEGGQKAKWACFARLVPLLTPTLRVLAALPIGEPEAAAREIYWTQESPRVLTDARYRAFQLHYDCSMLFSITKRAELPELPTL